MKRIILIAICLVFIFTAGAKGFDNMHLIDLPTARSLLRGYFDFKFSIYNGGGILMKIAVGLSDRFTLGVLEDIGEAISRDKPHFSLPGVFIKINIFSEDVHKIGWAMGYDMFTEGEFGKDWYNKRRDLIYGIYSSFSKPFKLFRIYSSFIFGLRYPVLPIELFKHGNNLSLYLGFHIPFNPEISLNLEVENIYITFKRMKEILYNASLKFVINDTIGLAVKIQYTSSRELNPSRLPARLITLEYQNLFY